MPSLINKIICTIDYRLLALKFDVYALSIDAGDIKERAKTIKEIKSKNQLLSHAYKDGLDGAFRASGVLLMKKDTPLHIRENTRVKKLSDQELCKVPLYILTRLLLRLLPSLSLKTEIFVLDNLAHSPGGIFYLVEHSPHGAVALEFDIQKNMSLSIKAHGFSRYKNSKNTQSYAIRGNKITPIISDSAEEIRYFKNAKGSRRRARVSYIGLSPSEYPRSQIYFLNKFLEEVRENLRDILLFEFDDSLQFVEFAHEKTLKVRKKLEEKVTRWAKVKGQINIVSYLQDKDVRPLALESLLRERLAGEFRLHFSSNTVADIPNIVLMHEKDFYEQSSLSDPYSTLRHNEHLLQVITPDSVNKDAIDVVLKELCIKDEIKNEHFFLPDEILPRGCAIIMPSSGGCMDEQMLYRFSSREIDAFVLERISSHHEREKIVEMIDAYRMDEGEKLEAIVQTMMGDINLIVRTSLFTLPNYAQIHDYYLGYNKEKRVGISSLYALFQRFFEKHELENIRNILNSAKDEDGYVDLAWLANSKLKLPRTVKREIKQVFGVNLQYEVKNKKAIEELYGGVGSIQYAVDENCGYYVSTLPVGLAKATIGNRPVVRKVISLAGELRLQLILPLLGEYFVKNGEPTVLPYPLKYLREFSKMDRRQ